MVPFVTFITPTIVTLQYVFELILYNLPIVTLTGYRTVPAGYR